MIDDRILYKGQTIHPTLVVRRKRWIAPVQWHWGREESTTGMEYHSSRMDAIAAAKTRVDLKLESMGEPGCTGMLEP